MGSLLSILDFMFLCWSKNVNNPCMLAVYSYSKFLQKPMKRLPCHWYNKCSLLRLLRLPFNQVLHNLTYWAKDEEFDVEHHFHHIALPKPARVRELLSYISKEHGRLLDRARPLWECHIIEGIEPESPGRPKRFGLYFKIHHSLVDGIAAMRLVQKSLSQSPNETLTLPLWALMMRHRYEIETVLQTKITLL